MSDLPDLEFSDPREKAAFLFVYRKVFKLEEADIVDACGISRQQYDQWRYLDPEFSRHVTAYSRRLLAELQPAVATTLARRLLSDEAAVKEYELYFKLINELKSENKDDEQIVFKAVFGNE